MTFFSVCGTCHFYLSSMSYILKLRPPHFYLPYHIVYWSFIAIRVFSQQEFVNRSNRIGPDALPRSPRTSRTPHPTRSMTRTLTFYDDEEEEKKPFGEGGGFYLPEGHILPPRGGAASPISMRPEAADNEATSTSTSAVVLRITAKFAVFNVNTSTARDTASGVDVPAGTLGADKGVGNDGRPKKEQAEQSIPAVQQPDPPAPPQHFFLPPLGLPFLMYSDTYADKLAVQEKSSAYQAAVLSASRQPTTKAAAAATAETAETAVPAPTPTPAHQPQSPLLAQVVSELLTEILNYLDVRSIMAFLGSSSALRRSTFVPSAPFRRALLRAALRRTNIAFKSTMVKGLRFAPKVVPSRTISAAYDGLINLPAETAPTSMAFLRDAQRCTRQLGQRTVAVPLVTKGGAVKLTLPCRRCPMTRNYKIDGDIQQGPCMRTVFWSCASCKKAASECEEHCAVCSECEENVCIDCLVEDYDSCRSCIYFTCKTCGNETLCEDAWECEGRIRNGRRLPCKGKVKCCVECSDNAGVFCCESCDSYCCSACSPMLHCVGCGTISCKECNDVRECRPGCGTVACADCDTCDLFEDSDVEPSPLPPPPAAFAPQPSPTAVDDDDDDILSYLK